MPSATAGAPLIVVSPPQPSRPSASRANRRTIGSLSSSSGRKAGELPYGSQRRVEIARALALAPCFLLLDEPTAGMVEGESEQLVASIRRIRDWMGCGVVIIDHNLHFITNVCERVYVLDMGRLIADGPPSVLRTNPKVAEVYLGKKAVH